MNVLFKFNVLLAFQFYFFYFSLYSILLLLLKSTERVLVFVCMHKQIRFLCCFFSESFFLCCFSCSLRSCTYFCERALPHSASKFGYVLSIVCYTISVFLLRSYVYFFCFFRLSASLRSNFSFKIKCKCKRSLWLLYRIYRVACTTFCVLHIEHTCANADDVFSDFFSLSHIKWSKRRIEKI